MIVLQKCRFHNYYNLVQVKAFIKQHQTPQSRARVISGVRQPPLSKPPSYLSLEHSDLNLWLISVLLSTVKFNDMQDRFARNLETHYGSSNIPESSTKAPSSTLASRPGVSQGTENQDINTGSIFSLYSDNVERSDQIAQPQLVESHHSQQQHFNLHAQHNMMRSISPPPHNSFPLEKPSVQTNDFDFDKLTDYAAYCSLEVETELDKIPSNEENTSLRAEYFTPEPGEPLLQAGMLFFSSSFLSTI